MLKIRNDVDLKELEKFGYDFHKFTNGKTEYRKFADDKSSNYGNHITIDTQTREVHCYKDFKRHEINFFYKYLHRWFIENVNALKEAGLLENWFKQRFWRKLGSK